MRSFCVFHYHFRPGGVRQVVERTLPPLLRQVVQTDRAVMLCGEAPDPEWALRMGQIVAPRKLIFEVVPELSYLETLGRPSTGYRQNLSQALSKVFLRHRPKLVWAHNLSVARNVLAGLELAKVAQAHGSQLLCHNHDWWTESRWRRWPEMLAWGVESEAEVAQAVCPSGDHVRHACVHPRDAALLSEHFGLRSEWLPNLSPSQLFPPTQEQLERGREKLGEKLPYWLAPVRVVGRKNLLEAMLLTHVMRGRHFATMGAASSPAESAWETRLAEGAQHLNMRLTVGLARQEKLPPSVLIAAATGLVQSSVQEGWGLPSQEAATVRRPLLLRQLPGLEHVQGPLQYTHLSIGNHRTVAEDERQRDLWLQAQNLCPPWWRSALMSAGAERRSAPSTFCQLSPAGQLEYLKTSASNGHGPLLEANPWLKSWREQALEEGWLESQMPPSDTLAEKSKEEDLWLSRFSNLLRSQSPSPKSVHVQDTLFRSTLSCIVDRPWLL
jgi:hypothetical protein